VLDNFATVVDALDAIKNVYIVSIQGEKGSGYSYATPKHLAMADVSGDSAIVEVSDGKLTVFHGEEYRVLTNPPSYQEELANAAKYNTNHTGKWRKMGKKGVENAPRMPDQSRVARNSRRIVSVVARRERTKETSTSAIPVAGKDRK